MRYILICLVILVLAYSVSAEIITSGFTDSSGKALGGITADIRATQTNNRIVVQILQQTYSSQLENFVGYSAAKIVFVNMQGVASDAGLAQSNPSNTDLASGRFPDMTFSTTIPEGIASLRVEYDVIGSGNAPDTISTTVEAHEAKTFILTPVQSTQPVNPTTPDQPTNPTTSNNQTQPSTPTEKQCSCVCQEICENKPIRDCPTIESLAGKASEYGTSAKVIGGFWKGGVVLKNGLFAGNCVGCAEAVNLQVQGVNCDETCKSACDARESKAEKVASDAVKICFNTFADACSTVGTTPLPVPRPVVGAPNKEVRISNALPIEKEERTPDEVPAFEEDRTPDIAERTEPARKKTITQTPKSITLTQFFVSVIDWFKELFGKPKLASKICTCTCEQSCDTTLVYGCAMAERTEKQAGGTITEWGTATGVVTNGNWKGLVEKQGKEFVGKCTVCADKLIIADVASEAGNACDNPCKNACVKNAKTVQQSAGEECRKRLEEACA